MKDHSSSQVSILAGKQNRHLFKFLLKRSNCHKHRYSQGTKCQKKCRISHAMREFVRWNNSRKSTNFFAGHREAHRKGACWMPNANTLEVSIFNYGCERPLPSFTTPRNKWSFLTVIQELFYQWALLLTSVQSTLVIMDTIGTKIWCT